MLDKWKKLEEWIDHKIEELYEEMIFHEKQHFESLREKAYLYKRAYEKVMTKMMELENDEKIEEKING